jgi:hypothetical protein
LLASRQASTTARSSFRVRAAESARGLPADFASLYYRRRVPLASAEPHTPRNIHPRRTSRAECRVHRRSSGPEVVRAVSDRISTAGKRRFPFMPPELPAAPYTGLMSISGGGKRAGAAASGRGPRIRDLFVGHRLPLDRAPGTEGSNPSPSSGESTANLPSLIYGYFTKANAEENRFRSAACADATGMCPSAIVAMKAAMGTTCSCSRTVTAAAPRCQISMIP